MVYQRRFWLDLVEGALRRRPVVLLSGVRRSGKTTLCRSVQDVEYFDCELPRVRRGLDDPAAFWAGLKGKRVVLDEAHRLADPLAVLAQGSHDPQRRILAAGCWTPETASGFGEGPAARAMLVRLTPMNSADLEDFGRPDMQRRLIRGGLPPFLLMRKFSERAFQDWMDAFLAKDLLGLFRIDRRHSFQRFLELVFTESGRMFESARFAKPCGVSRETVTKYLRVLKSVWLAHVVAPFHSERGWEILAAPKVYGCDTGLVCCYRGWHRSGPGNLGALWEHFVLNEIVARLQHAEVRYWRDKRGHEVDFVLTGGGQPTAFECAWTAEDFDPAGLRAFRREYPRGGNWVVASDVDRPFLRRYGDLEVGFIGLAGLAVAAIAAGATAGNA